ncbi:MAG TPA: hypothetical protein VGD43_00890, partial [Micromonospora sp.]
DAAVDVARGLAPAVADALAAAAGRLRAEVAEMTADPKAPAVVAGARGTALRMGYALTAALLVEQAVWGDPAAEVAARLWVRRWLRGEDVAADAYPHLELLG